MTHREGRIFLELNLAVGMLTIAATAGCGNSAEADDPSPASSSLSAELQLKKKKDAGDVATESDTGAASDASPPEPVCSGALGWSWNDRYPTADGTDIIALWAASPSDVWESRGIHGIIHHYDGTQWTDVPLGTGNVVKAIYGTAANDVWAVGTAGLMAHYDGVHWSCIPAATTSDLNDVWANSASDVWAGGDGELNPTLGTAVTSVVLHGNGSTWSRAAVLPWVAPFPAGSGCSVLNVKRVWGSSATDAWALVDRHCSGNLGTRSSVARWNGTAWQSMLDSACSYSTMLCYTAGWASSPNNAVVLTRTQGANPTGGFVAWNGTSWGNSTATTVFSGVWGAAQNDFWLSSLTGAQHWNGTAFQSYAVNGAHVTGSSATNVWIYGPLGARNQWNGSSWSNRSTPTLTTASRGEGFKTIWGSGSDAVWAIASQTGKVLRHVGLGWAETASPLGIVSISGTGPNDLRAVDGTTDLVRSFNGSTWSQGSAGVGVPLNAVWARATNDIWAVGNSTVDSSGLTTRYYKTTVHWNGTSWSRVAVEAPGAGTGTAVNLLAVAGTAANDVWASADNGARLHWNGSAWSETAGLSSLTKLWVGGPNDVWFYGGTNYAHWDGATWTTGSWTFIPTTLSGPSSSDWWWGDNAINHWDGATQTLPFTGFDRAIPLTTVWANATDVYAGSTGGVTMHFGAVGRTPRDRTNARFRSYRANFVIQVVQISRADQPDGFGVCISNKIHDNSALHARS